jgi:hypothetical protein
MDVLPPSRHDPRVTRARRLPKKTKLLPRALAAPSAVDVSVSVGVVAILVTVWWFLFQIALDRTAVDGPLPTTTTALIAGLHWHVTGYVVLALVATYGLAAHPGAPSRPRALDVLIYSWPMPLMMGGTMWLASIVVPEGKWAGTIIVATATLVQLPFLVALRWRRPHQVVARSFLAFFGVMILAFPIFLAIMAEVSANIEIVTDKAAYQIDEDIVVSVHPKGYVLMPYVLDIEVGDAPRFFGEGTYKISSRQHKGGRLITVRYFTALSTLLSRPRSTTKVVEHLQVF